MNGGASHRRRVIICLGVLLVSLCLSEGTNGPPFQPTLPDDTLWPQGRYIYQRNCLVCHGANGDGRGEMGKELKPPPRDFSRGLFKYRSTPPGFLPTDADLIRVVRGGLTGTAMPIFSQLSDREVRSVVEYLKSFSFRWRYGSNYATAMVLPPVPKWFDDPGALARRAGAGRGLFEFACAPCHGADGSGRGALAQAIEDPDGVAVTPADLRLEPLRSGTNWQGVYRVLITGIEGSAMPAFADSLSEAQRWDLVACISELRRGFRERQASPPP